MVVNVLVMAFIPLYCRLPYVFKSLIDFDLIRAAAAQFELYIPSGMHDDYNYYIHKSFFNLYIGL